MSKPPRTFQKLLQSYSPDVRALALAARDALRRWLPAVEETVDSSAPVASYGYGPGYRGMVCTLIFSKSGVKLGLVRGSELPDPHGLLEGTGKVHRYVQLREASDLRRAGVSALVKSSHAAWRERMAR